MYNLVTLKTTNRLSVVCEGGPGNSAISNYFANFVLVTAAHDDMNRSSMMHSRIANMKDSTSTNNNSSSVFNKVGCVGPSP